MALPRPTRGWLLLLLALPLQSLLSEATFERKFSDGEVILSLRPSLDAMRKSLRMRSMHVSEVFRPDAAIHVNVGPAKSLFKHLNFQDPDVLTFRGRDEIATYHSELSKAIAQVGLSAFQLYEESGLYAPRFLVASDSEVVIAGKFAVHLRTGGKAQGEILSETWVREGDGPWMIKSAMYAWEQLRDADKPQGSPKAKALAEIATSEISSETIKSVAPTSAGGENPSEAAGGSHILVFLGLAVFVVLAFVFLEHRRRQKSAQWSSINSGGDVWLG